MILDKRYSVIYLALVLFLTAISVTVMRFFAPDSYSPTLFLIPAYFCLMLVLMNVLYHLGEKKKRDRSFFFMEYRMIKMLVSIVFLFVILKVAEFESLSFVIVFVAFYLILMSFETVHFIKGEKKS
ncbi:MAG: hypothetical protein MJY75_03060 [Bacteroidaceae bacterium]|nr:hypothetical protein [Bacteroidaceae bacterium]